MNRFLILLLGASFALTAVAAVAEDPVVERHARLPISDPAGIEAADRAAAAGTRAPGRPTRSRRRYRQHLLAEHGRPGPRSARSRHSDTGLTQR